MILTDRGKAPWVLENIRGAVAANGLPLAYTRTAISASTPAYTEDLGGTGADSKHMNSYVGRREGVCHRRGAGGLKHSGRGHSAVGSCCVHELSWGDVSPATIELAKACPTPKVTGLPGREKNASKGFPTSADAVGKTCGREIPSAARCRCYRSSM